MADRIHEFTNLISSESIVCNWVLWFFDPSKTLTKFYPYVSLILSPEHVFLTKFLNSYIFSTCIGWWFPKSSSSGFFLINSPPLSVFPTCHIFFTDSETKFFLQKFSSKSFQLIVYIHHLQFCFFIIVGHKSAKAFCFFITSIIFPPLSNNKWLLFLSPYQKNF